MPRLNAAILMLLLPVAAMCQTHPASDSHLSSTEMKGLVGQYPIGLNYTVRDHTQLVAARYFYASKLKDITLTGSVNGNNVTLHGADGSDFQLTFVGNGSNGKEPLTFYNSVGLQGTWSQSGRTLPVKLSNDHGTVNPGTRQYADATDQPDAAIDAMVLGAKQAILSGNADAAARCMNFPVRVNSLGANMQIRNRADLRAKFSSVFTPAYIAKLRDTVPHDMFVRNGMIMLGDGMLWFNDKGVSVINAVK